MDGSNDKNLVGLVPYLYYRDGNAALEWLTRVLGFREIVRYVDESGTVFEAEIAIGDARVELAGGTTKPFDEAGVPGPVGQLLVVKVTDVDAHHAHTVAQGVDVPAPEDQPFGARTYTVTDPQGYRWNFRQPIEMQVQLPPGCKELRSDMTH